MGLPINLPTKSLILVELECLDTLVKIAGKVNMQGSGRCEP
jgi:hypothetical protein